MRHQTDCQVAWKFCLHTMEFQIFLFSVRAFLRVFLFHTSAKCTIALKIIVSSTSPHFIIVYVYPSYLLQISIDQKCFFLFSFNSQSYCVTQLKNRIRIE